MVERKSIISLAERKIREIISKFNQEAIEKVELSIFDLMTELNCGLVTAYNILSFIEQRFKNAGFNVERVPKKIIIIRPK